MHVLLILAVAVLMGMGVGGGGLLVICLVFFEGVEQYTAQGINLIFFIACAAASMLIHLQRRRIRWPLLWGILPGAVASYLAAGWAEKMPVGLLRLLFGVLLCLCGGGVLLTTFFGRKGKK